MSDGWAVGGGGGVRAVCSCAAVCFIPCGLACLNRKTSEGTCGTK